MYVHSLLHNRLVHNIQHLCMHIHTYACVQCARIPINAHVRVLVHAYVNIMPRCVPINAHMRVLTYGVHSYM